MNTRQRTEHVPEQRCASGLVETWGRRFSQKCFNTVGGTRSRSKTCGASGSGRPGNFPQGSLSSHAIEQLTISGLSRHGQPELENHSRLRAPMAWQDIQTQVERYLSTTYHHQSPQPIDISAVLTSAECQSCGSQTHQRNDCWYKEKPCRTCGKRRYLTKVCRSGNAQTPRHQSPKGTCKGSGKGSGKSEGRGKKRTPEKCMCCGKEGHKTADCKSKTAECSNCGKVGHLTAVCRNTNTRD